MDSYLENAMDYVQSTFENANEWLKAHDPLKFPEVDAVCNRAVPLYVPSDADVMAEL
jgi:hypothetical protein